MEVSVLPHAPTRIGGRNIRRNARCPAYNINLSTEENYSVKDTEETSFSGPYSHIRSTLDYTYHAHYKAHRQRFQDCIITMLLTTSTKDEVSEDEGSVCTTPSQPWIIFTAGAMGAGKRHSTHQLVHRDLMPLLSFVYIDSDEIRRHFPEYLTYATRNTENVGKFTRKEAGYIAEIAMLAAVQNGANVIVDGIMNDWEWHKSVFDRLRESHPKLRIGLLHVVAPEEAILSRAQVRAKAILYLDSGEKLCQVSCTTCYLSFFLAVLLPLKGTITSNKTSDPRD